MKLPEEYINRMKRLLEPLGKDEFDKYIDTLNRDRFHGLRVNTLKLSTEDFLKISPFELNPVPWAETGFYYNDAFPGRHPFYHAGLFYIQEPSAMYPGASLDVEEGDKVLDICAAPGGKSTQLAAKMQGRGILVSNDISEERVHALVKNLEMAGVTNCIITNESPENLADNLPEYFDKILVDAPCSGEGMFRKDEYAIGSWEKFKNEHCRAMQDEILEYVHKMLKPGGKLIYSTCTFAPIENEETIKAFMEKHPEYTLLPLKKVAGIMPGLFGMEEVSRLWPQRVEGEGHFTALLQKGGEPKKSENEKKNTKSYEIIDGIPEEIKAFYKKNMTIDAPEGVYLRMGEGYYFLPCLPPDLDGLKVARVGLYLGQFKGKNFKPSHPFAMAQKAEHFKRTVSLKCDSTEIQKYLRGDTLVLQKDECEDGLLAVCAEGYVLGLGQNSGGVIKNMYPKGWRRQS